MRSNLRLDLVAEGEFGEKDLPRRLERFKFVTHDKKAKFEIDLERRLEYR